MIMMTVKVMEMAEGVMMMMEVDMMIVTMMEDATSDGACVDHADAANIEEIGIDCP